ncbi:MAG: aromatic ring-hydroxylating dioxygenase subunit alpha [Parvibaculaceae bacterium]|nr:aromatic ring-hydroxylating dioxygenase subunit alpha [Parvibaculaceae bacterium]
MEMAFAGQTPPLVDDRSANGIFRVSRHAFVEQSVFESEQREIFNKCWLYLGHDSEVAAPGDFLTRSVVGRKIIFTRNKAGKVGAFFNTCPHRGALVCREKQGSANLFRCFYHSWAFDLDGKLINRPGHESYADDANANGEHNLVPVPRLESYRGLYFLNFDRNACDLASYLGNSMEFIDLVMDQSADGMEVIGGTQEYGFKANWKLLAENSADGYHGQPTHATYFDYVMSTNGNLGDNVVKISKPHDLGQGHAVVEYGAPWGRPIAKAVPAWGEEGEREAAALRADLTQRLGAERADRIAYTNRNMVIFPNFVINDIMAITLRTFEPVGPGQMRVNAWALGPKGEAPKARERRLYNFLEFLGPGGFATPDDCEALALCQEGYSNMAEAGWNDISKGLNQERPTIEDEVQMRAFWREWSRRIEGERA